jgi:hypothetical protein
MIMARPSEEEVKQAEGLLRRAYYADVTEAANELAIEFITGGIDDMADAIHERADQEVTYTHRQYQIIAGSESIDEGLERMRDLGHEGLDNFIAVLAYSIYEVGLEEAISRNWDGLVDARNAEEWIEENTKLFYRSGSTEARFLERDTEEESGILIVEPKTVIKEHRALILEPKNTRFVPLSRLTTIDHKIRVAFDAFMERGGEAMPEFVDEEADEGKRCKVCGEVDAGNTCCPPARRDDTEAVARELQARGLPVRLVGLNADWNTSAWSLGRNYYLVDDESELPNGRPRFNITLRTQVEDENAEDEIIVEGTLEECLDEFTNPREEEAPDHPSAAELEAMPTISQGHTGNLKFDNGRVRIWLERVGVDDGMPYDNGVIIEHLRNGRWVTVEEYAG